MFVVVFDNGAIVTQATHTWHEVGHLAREEKRTIQQLILTDMHHFREAIAGADAYYYFTEGEAILQHGLFDGDVIARALVPSVPAEEIAGFYSVKTACRFYEQNITACDSNLVEIEKKIGILRATPITSEETQTDINRQLSDKLSLKNTLIVKRAALMKERKKVMDAGGFIVAKRLVRQGTKFPLNIDSEQYGLIDSGILHQNPDHWVGTGIPAERIMVDKTEVAWDEFVGNWVIRVPEI